MKVPLRGRGSGLAFNLTPLIDVVFNLVIFFVITSHFTRNEAADPIELPTAVEVSNEDEAPRRLIITILPGGALRVGGRDVAQDEIDLLIEDAAAEDADGFEVQVRADAGAPYARVEPILLTCARNGIRQVGFKVIEKHQRPGS
jgi:biopolymer transport protein ExbD